MPKQINFFDGAQSSTVPTIGNIDTTSLIGYADDATYEAANAGSPIEGNIYFNTTTKYVRYYDGTSWVNVHKDAGDVSYDNATSGLTATDVQGAIDETEGRVDTAETNISNAQTDITDLETLSGSSGATDHGTFSGTTIPDSSTTKAALQSLETEVETKIASSEKGAANGVATLDGSGKVPSSQLTISAFEYLGTWDASTNTPTLADGVGDTGDTYRVSVAGTQDLGSGNITFAVDDRIVYNPSGDWEKWGNAGVGDLWGDPVDAHIIPDTDDTYDLGSSSNRFRQTITRNLEAKGSNTTSTGAISATNSNGDAFCRMQGGFSTPTGVAQSAAFHSLSDLPGDLAMYTNNDATADANPTKDVAIETGNKTAGTGDSGDIKMTIGTSSGGSQGDFKFIKSGDTVTSGHVWTASATDGTGYWAVATGGANDTLSNLSAPTSVNEDLNFNSSRTTVLKNNNFYSGRNVADSGTLAVCGINSSDQPQLGSSSAIVRLSASNVLGGGNLGSSGEPWASFYATNFRTPLQFDSIAGTFKTIDDTATLDIDIFTGTASAGNSGDICIFSGAATGGDSGHVLIETGTATGTRGEIQFREKTLPGASVNDVWTLQNATTGEGGWVGAPAVGNRNVGTYNSTATITSTDDIALLTGASFTLTLTTAVGNTGKIFEIVHSGTSLTQVYTIDGNGGETIRGNTTFQLHTNGERLRIVSDGANWVVLDHYSDTDWVNAGAITIGATTTAPTKPTGIATDNVWWRRNGGSAEIRIEYRQTNTTSAAAGTGDYLFQMPTNIAIDTTKITASTTVFGGTAWHADSNVGDFASRGGGPSNSSGNVTVYDTNNVRFMAINNASQGVIGAGFNNITADANLCYIAEFTVPVDGWEY